MAKPDFKYENELWAKGVGKVAGCDEVGRGCFAGPVVAGTVVFASDTQITKNMPVRIDDSKKMTVKQRVEADMWVRENSLAFGIGEANVNEINTLGIVRATNMAFRRSIMRCGVIVEHLLTDAFLVPLIKGIGMGNQTPIVKGDTLSFSIAAASIVAKVYRDNLMEQIGKSREYKKYGLDTNRGYGTKNHREAIKNYGTTKHHRKQFVETYLSKLNIAH